MQEKCIFLYIFYKILYNYKLYFFLINKNVKIIFLIIFKLFFLFFLLFLNYFLNYFSCKNRYYIVYTDRYYI